MPRVRLYVSDKQPKLPDWQLLGDENDYAGTTVFYREFTRFCNAAHEPKINTFYPIGAYWPSIDAFMDAPSLPMRFYSADPKGNDKKVAGLYLTGYTRGYYGHVNDLPERMSAFAEKHDLVFTRPVYPQRIDFTSFLETLILVRPY